MKKIFVAASFLALSFGAFAQDNTEKSTEGFVSKNGHQVLPEAGDWSVSFDAVPVFQYFGNAFNSDSNNTISAAFPNGIPAITGRYFLDANTAVRARVRIGLQSNTEKTTVTSSGGAEVENKTKTKSSNIYLSAGIEKRKGKSRVQGIYGAEFIINISSDPNQKFEFGEPLSNTNPGTRTVEIKNGNTLAVGPRAFLGAEYFFAPKFSIGAEFGWGLMFSKTGKSETTTETWSGTGVTSTTTQTSAGDNGIKLDTDNVGGSINLSFYF